MARHLGTGHFKNSIVLIDIGAKTVRTLPKDVAVHPECQGRGIGALLVARLMEESRKEGCYKVILDCAETVIPFYEKLGFRKWERAMRIDLE